MAGRLKRHPLRGAFAGLFLGLGLAIILVSYKVMALGTLTPWVVIGIGVVLGVAFSLLVPAFDGGAEPAPVPTAHEPAPPEPAPTTAPTGTTTITSEPTETAE